MAASWRDEKTRITRDEAKEYVRLLEREMPKTSPDGPVYFWFVCGSWRRRAETIGDFDILVVTENGTFTDVRDKLPKSFVAEHEGPQVIQGKLYLHPHYVSIDPGVSITGVSETVVPERSMNADFYACTPDQVGAALMFLTGPAALNIVQRAWAKKLGFKLSQYGLFTAELVHDKPYMIPCYSEEQVYRRLGLKWLTPEEREAFKEVKPPDDAKIQTWDEKSDTDPNKVYEVTLKGEGANSAWSCRDKRTGAPCMAFKYSREIPRSCKHIKRRQAKEST